MYNRYVPQSDGSYLRSSVPDPTRQTPPMPKPRQPEPPPPPPEPPRPQHRKQSPPQRPQPRPAQGAGSFLKQLLPRDLDTGDLLVVLLLLLISAESGEDRSNSLLTLALYLLL